MIAEVVKVDAEYHGCPRGVGNRLDDIHQLGLAVVTAIGVVDAVRGAFHFVGHDRCPPQAPLGGEHAAVGFLVAGERC